MQHKTRLTLTLSQAAVAQLENMAGLAGCSKSTVVEDAIAELYAALKGA